MVPRSLGVGIDWVNCRKSASRLVLVAGPTRSKLGIMTPRFAGGGGRGKPMPHLMPMHQCLLRDVGKPETSRGGGYLSRKECQLAVVDSILHRQLLHRQAVAVVHSQPLLFRGHTLWTTLCVLCVCVIARLCSSPLFFTCFLSGGGHLFIGWL